ncbi:hypothetical protein F8203_gp171 [Heliothis virescens ascovirus 3f]|uniref:Uncharacterized protein n=1 Tax=Heliothis virescens ascovirus 3f TaxID=328614 RepID=A0A171PVQ9_9VIRU|nr:hypothetical protein F8203_gp171 [Heliothis virescens ascovirus 3f]AJP09137.1 hypothetical protein [Heliothis virescens ascovirus 3f]
MYDPFVIALFIVGLSVSLANKICTDDQCYLWCIQQATRSWWAFFVDVYSGVCNSRRDHCQCVDYEGNCLNC